MKLYIKSTTEGDSYDEITKKSLIAILKSYGIDTTTHTYELEAEEYTRYRDEEHDNYSFKFKCPGDYLAYFAMVLHHQPDPSLLEDYFGIDYFRELVKTHPTVEDIQQYASSHWYGDGDDYIYSLKNLDTGKILYEGDYEIERDYEDELV